MLVRTAWLSHPGQKREINEDSVAIVAPEGAEAAARLGTLLVVADGMGGANAGEVASDITTRVMAQAYYVSHGGPREALETAIRAAQEAIRREAARDESAKGMGTTVVAAAMAGGGLVVANVGDSRAYLLRGGALRQLTRDHSLVAELVALGALTREEARTDRRRNIVTRALGGESCEPELYPPEELRPGDAVLLCTDGLHTLVSDEEMADALRRMKPPVAVEHLVAVANSRGGADNVTIAVACVEGAEPSRRPWWRVWERTASAG